MKEWVCRKNRLPSGRMGRAAKGFVGQPTNRSASVFSSAFSRHDGIVFRTIQGLPVPPIITG